MTPTDGAERDPHGLDPHAPGAKLDDGKPWTTTVLRGFWPVLRDRFPHNQYFQEADVFFGSSRFEAIQCVLGGMERAAITGAIQVGTFGARKYTRDGWLSVPDGVARYDEAAGRHLWALLCGEECCPDSGLRHYYHFCWNVLACARLLHVPTSPDETTSPASSK